MVRGRKKEANSLRSLGMSSLGVDKLTKARIKRLAGDTPICAKVRELVELGELVESGASPGGQVPLDTLERLSSSAPASKRDVAMLSTQLLKGQELDVFVLVKLGFSQFESQLNSLRLELANRGELTYLEEITNGGEQLRLAEG